MAQVKSSLWNITNDPLPLQHVKVSGQVEDFRGTFTLVQTYQSHTAAKDCVFHFLLYDIGTVTGFKAMVGGTQIDSTCLPRTSPKLTAAANKLIKTHSDLSATDAFICKIDSLDADTEVQFHITFLQELKLDRQSLRFCLPTTISPKTYFHESGSSDQSQRIFNFDLDVAVKMSETRPIKTIRSPSHSLNYTPSGPTQGQLSVSGDLSDNDLTVLIDFEKPLSESLPQALVESHPDREIIMLTLLPHFEVPHIEVDDDDEEGHPDPREILVVVDPNQLEFENLLVILKAFLSTIDVQTFFNIILLSKNVTRASRLFPKSQPGIAQFVRSALTKIETEAFKTQFQEGKADKPQLIQGLKPVFDFDCYSEDIPRTVLLLSKGQVPNAADLFEVVSVEKDVSVYTLGLGVDSNAYVLNTMACACEIVYSDPKDPSYEEELKDKLKTQIQRITQPAFSSVTVDWGKDLTKNMVEMTPSKDLPLQFWRSDLLTIFGVAENPKPQPWNIKIKVESKHLPSKPSFEVRVDPKACAIEGSQVEKLQLKRERDTPDSTQHVRLRKLQDIATASGIASAGTSFFGTDDKGILLVSASDTFLDNDEEAQKPIVKYDVATLLKFQPHNMDKPALANLGETEKGVAINMPRPHGATRSRGAKRAATQVIRAKKLRVATQWTSAQLDDFFRSINALLNKMSPDNFESLKTKLLAMKGQIEAEFEALDVIVKLVFEKALVSTRFAPLYADLCVCLANELTANLLDKPKDPNQEPKEVNFRVLILKHCRENFENCFAEGEAASENQTAEDIAEKEFRVRARLSANIAFIGELFLRNLLRSNILHAVIRSLFREDREGNLTEPEPQFVELACHLFTTLNVRLESEDSLSHTERYFAHLATFKDSTKYDMRVKFKVRELIELRANSWVPRKGSAALSGKPAITFQSVPSGTPGSPPTSPPPKRVIDKPDPRKEGGRGDRGRGGRGDRGDRGRGDRGGRGGDRGGRDGDRQPLGRSNDWGRAKDKNAPTGSSRVDARDDGWSEIRGRRTAKPAPAGNSQRGDPKRAPKAWETDSASRGRGGARAGPGAPAIKKEGSTTNAFTLLNSGRDDDDDSEEQSQ